MDEDKYEAELRKRQLALVRWQKQAMAGGDKVVIVFEGRDAAGKDGSIHALTEHMSVRATRVVALPKPNERESSQWYFQRYIRYLPAAGETLIFNRSWYNRAGVERVMGFASPADQSVFLREVPLFEKMLVESGIQLVKLWLDVSKDEQRARLHERATDPLKALKASPMDAAAQAKWDDYTAARDDMLSLTHSKAAPWTIVKSDHKKKAHLALLSCLVRTLAPGLSDQVDAPDPEVIFAFTPEALKDGRLAR